MAFEVEYFQLQAADATSRSVALTTGIPTDSSDVALDLIGGSAQALGADFRVDGTVVHWDYTSSSLYTTLTTSDRIRVIYDRS